MRKLGKLIVAGALGLAAAGAQISERVRNAECDALRDAVTAGIGGGRWTRAGVKALINRDPDYFEKELDELVEVMADDPFVADDAADFLEKNGQPARAHIVLDRGLAAAQKLGRYDLAARYYEKLGMVTEAQREWLKDAEDYERKAQEKGRSGTAGTNAENYERAGSPKAKDYWPQAAEDALKSERYADAFSYFEKMKKVDEGALRITQAIVGKNTEQYKTALQWYNKAPTAGQDAREPVARAIVDAALTEHDYETAKELLIGLGIEEMVVNGKIARVALKNADYYVAGDYLTRSGYNRADAAGEIAKAQEGAADFVGAAQTYASNNMANRARAAYEKAAERERNPERKAGYLRGAGKEAEAQTVYRELAQKALGEGKHAAAANFFKEARMDSDAHAALEKGVEKARSDGDYVALADYLRQLGFDEKSVAREAGELALSLGYESIAIDYLLDAADPRAQEIAKGRGDERASAGDWQSAVFWYEKAKMESELENARAQLARTVAVYNPDRAADLTGDNADAVDAVADHLEEQGRYGAAGKYLLSVGDGGRALENFFRGVDDALARGEYDDAARTFEAAGMTESAQRVWSGLALTESFLGHHNSWPEDPRDYFEMAGEIEAAIDAHVRAAAQAAGDLHNFQYASLPRSEERFLAFAKRRELSDAQRKRGLAGIKHAWGDFLDAAKLFEEIDDLESALRAYLAAYQSFLDQEATDPARLVALGGLSMVLKEMRRREMEMEVGTQPRP